MPAATYENETLYGLRRAQLSILSFFSNFCETNDLNWFMCYGSLLGAVRHGGYIPWDDDLDVGMLREDYDRMIDLLSGTPNDDFELLHVAKNSDYHLSFAKIQMKRTLYQEERLVDEEVTEGIYMDIFVFDYIPDDEVQALKFRKRTAFWQMIFAAMMIETPQISAHGDVETKKKQWKLIHDFARITHFPKHLIYKLFDIKRKKYSKHPTTMAADIKGSSEAIFKADLLTDTIEWYFEGVKVRIPKDYITVLTQIYGPGYKNIPSVENRRNHNIVELDFGDWTKRLEAEWIDQASVSGVNDFVTGMKTGSETVAGTADGTVDDGHPGRTILYHYNICGFINHGEEMISKLRFVINAASCKEGLTLILAPSVCLQEELAAIDGALLEDYRAVTGDFTMHGGTVLPIEEIRTGTCIESLADVIDAYYGDYTSMVEVFIQKGIPAMLQDYGIYEEI